MAQAKTISMTRHAFAEGSFKQMLIDGKWVDAASGKHFESRNPATGELLATVAEGNAEDINRAVAAARKAFEGPWSKFKPYERQQVLLKLANLVERNFDDLSSLDTLDMGAPISRTGQRGSASWACCATTPARRLAAWRDDQNSLPGEIFSYTLKEPVGVVGAIMPWNSPLGASIWKIRPALAAGCTVIFKPAEEAPLTSLRLGALALEAECRRASSTSCPDTARRREQRWLRIPASIRWRSPARALPDSRSCERPRATSSGYRSNSAANLPTSYSPTPISVSCARCRHGGVRQFRPDLQRWHPAFCGAKGVRRIRRPRSRVR